MPDSSRSAASQAAPLHEVTAEDESQGAGGGLRDSILLLVSGLVLVMAGCGGIAWNEAQLVSGRKAVDTAGAVVVQVSADKIDPAITGKLVHVAGPVTSANGVKDPDIGLTVKGVRLARTVEMLQWTQIESGSGADKKFTYKTDWRDQAVNSATFNEPNRYNNPRFPVIRSRVYTAQDAVIGTYPLGPAALVALEGGDLLNATPAELELARNATGRSAVLISGGFYFGESPDSPRLGDFRATYRVVSEGPASFIARQGAQGLERFKGEKGESILLAAPGILSPDEVLRYGPGPNPLYVWLGRAAGILVLFLGFLGVFIPAEALGRIIPALTPRLAGATIRTAAAATMMAGSCAVAAVWLMQRPMVSAALVASGLAAAFVLLLLGARRRGTPAAA